MPTRDVLYVRCDEGHGPPLVLLHGMFGDGTQWRKIAHLLRADYRVISVDLFGHGRSPRPKASTYSAAEHVAYLRRTLEQLGATGQVTLVGYSMGGAVALAYAKTYQSEIDQLYLLSTPFYLKPDQMIAANYTGSLALTKLSLGAYGLVERLLGAGRLDWLLRIGNRSRLFHDMIGAQENNLEAEIVRRNIKQLVHEFDFVGYLDGLDVPMTFYAGKSDPFIIQGQVNALKRFNKNMHIERLDIIKIDHMLVQNLPYQIARLVSVNRASTLHVGVDTGKGKALVLLHGIESSSDYWRGVVAALAEGRRVIALDLLGFGQSPKPLNIAYSLDDQVRWVRRTLQALGVRHYEVIGHSLGGLVALALAAAEPDKVRSLTLLAPVFTTGKSTAGNPLLKRIEYAERFSDDSYLYSKTAQAIGDKRIAKYLPSLRSLQNAVKRQDARRLAKLAKTVPVTIAWGTKDPLIDEPYLKRVSAVFRQANLRRLPDVSHNFVMYRPEMLLDVLGIDIARLRHQPEMLAKLPPSFARQLVRLAAPVLWLKSLAYVGAGALLFTDAAAWVLTAGLAVYVISRSYKLIRGAFSLRNEHLSYMSYLLLAGFTLLLAIALYNRPALAVRIAVVIICCLVGLNGLTRLLVGSLWTREVRLRRRLLLSGAAMVCLTVLALAGSLVSLYIIVYTIAILAILRGVQYGLYGLGAFVMAYVRGFSRP